MRLDARRPAHDATPRAAGRQGGEEGHLLSHARLARWRRNDAWPGGTWCAGADGLRRVSKGTGSGRRWRGQHLRGRACAGWRRRHGAEGVFARHAVAGRAALRGGREKRRDTVVTWRCRWPVVCPESPCHGTVPDGTSAGCLGNPCLAKRCFDHPCSHSPCLANPC